jgi:hypothetical protein
MLIRDKRGDLFVPLLTAMSSVLARGFVATCPQEHL